MEPVGLALGVAGLAGLFSVCLECFNIVQQGRYLGRDYFILETKYTNQRLRLLTWGRACGFIDASSMADIEWNDDIRLAVSETLTRIASLFQDHRTLRRRYGLSMDQPNSDKAVSAAPRLLSAWSLKLRSTGLAVAELGAFNTAPGRSSTKRPSFPATMRWAVDDKRKFAELVQHLKDFNDDLEALTVDLHVPQRQRELIRAEVGHISDVSELETIEEARMGITDAVADAAGLRLCQIHNELDTAKLSAKQESSEPREAPTTKTMAMTELSDDEWDMVDSNTCSATVPVDMCYQVLHRVICDTQPTSIFFDSPSYHHRNGPETGDQWLVLDADSPLRDPVPIHLSGQRLLPSLKSYLDHNAQLSFLVFQEYNCSHNIDGRRQVVPDETCIYLTSEPLCSMLDSLLVGRQRPTFRPNLELRPPYAWFYHNRDLLTPLSRQQRPLTQSASWAEMLLGFIEDSTNKFYNELAESIHMPSPSVTWQHLPLLFPPHKTVLERFPDGDDDFRALEQTGPPRVVWTEDEVPVEVLEIPVARYSCFAGTWPGIHISETQRIRIPRSLFKERKTPPPESLYPIHSQPIAPLCSLSELPVVPLHLVPSSDHEYLIERGRKAAGITHGMNLVVYETPEADTNGEYIVDLAMYEQQHQRGRKALRPKMEIEGLRDEGVEDDDLLKGFKRPVPDIQMPHALPGFHLRDHVWRRLLVRNMEFAPSPNAKINDLIIGEEAKKSLKKPLRGMEKPSWQSWCRSGGVESDLAQIITIFHGSNESVEAAVQVASRMTKRPIYRIRVSGHTQTETVDAMFQQARSHNAKWGCIFVVEDAAEAYTAHNLIGPRINLVVLPLLQFMDNLGGIVVFVVPNNYSEGDEVDTLIDPLLIRRVCRIFEFTPQDADKDTRGELWKECIRDRLSSKHGFLKNLQHEVQRLAEFPLTWASIQSTVHAVVPKGTDPSDIDWDLFMELLEQRPKPKEPPPVWGAR